MNDQQRITEFSQSAEQGDSDESADDSDEFGWGSFGKPPEDWPINRIEELFEIQKDSVDPEKLSKEEMVHLYSMPAFDDGGKPELTKARNIGSKKFHVPNQALLFSKLNISKKRFWLVNHSHDEPALCSTEYWPILPADGLNLEFYLQYFNSDSFINRPRLSTSSTTNSHQRIKTNLFDKVRLPIPPLPEQRKIATVLYTIDRAIEKTEEIESQVRRTQNGIVQETLKCGLGESDISDTGTKLGEIPTHWELTSIDEIVADEEHSFTDGARYALSSAEIHEEGEARAILLQEVGEGEFNDEDPKFATGEKYEEITHRAIYPGEVVVAKMAEPVARACIVPDKYDKYLLGCADVVRIQTNDEFDSRFLMYCMNSHKVWRQAVAHLRGTGRSRINLENIAELKLPKPPLDEQIEIADALETFEDRIQTERECRESLQRLKHGLMQDLLSGKVRTTDTKIEVPEGIAKYG